MAPFGVAERGIIRCYYAELIQPPDRPFHHESCTDGNPLDACMQCILTVEEIVELARHAAAGGCYQSWLITWYSGRPQD